jgi:Uma2 family endonuclease
MRSAVPRHRYTLRDYLDVEEMSAVKHEYLDGEIYAMAGGTPEHAALCGALVVLVGAQLGGGPCRIYTSDLRLRVLATGLATYPDAAVVCGPPERDPQSPTHVTNPTLVFEVLSPSTEEYDHGEKREHYQKIDSLRAYVTVAQDRRLLTIWRREGGARWSRQDVGAGQSLALEPIGCTLGVDDLYARAGLDLS